MSSETNAMESGAASDPAQLRLVAIDGVLGSGKTTVAQRLAKELGLQYLDTGAMYRSVGLACAWGKVDLTDEAAVTAIARSADIDVRSDADGVQQVRLNGDDVTTEIRTPEAARAASTVATIAGVRAALVAQQRTWGNRHAGGVLEGRDIATVVFPNAPAKIYLTASVEERARRRHSEQSDRTLAEVAADLAWRDEQDSTRAADPLRIADGATVVDTTTMSLDEVVERCVAIAHTRFAEANISLPFVGSPESRASLGSASNAPMRSTSSTSSTSLTSLIDATTMSVPIDADVAVDAVAPVQVDAVAGVAVAGAAGVAVHAASGVAVDAAAGVDGAADLGVGPAVDVEVGPEVRGVATESARSVAPVTQYVATRNEKILWWLARFLVLGFSKLYFRVTFEGLENVPKTGAYLVSPTHRSNVDSFVVLGLTKRRIRFLAKEEMWKLSFVHPLWDALGGIKVERGSTDRESMKLCMAALASGEPLAAYPEGTRREGLVVEGLFDGPAYMALKAGVPIVPMGIGGSALAMGRGDKFPKPKHIHVVIGKPLNSPPSTETGRRHIRALTAELGASLQVLLDEAQQKA
jgi:cytidylate kinase